ncbi:hypothetical protein SAMN05446037_104919 [Anaerovirgula multivorans]|uniref:Uncharacterized protein n=2 Tax=Anaerovirgula multivorans TaxID=312168 RepID=A0A239KL05_9FIRM|nr:hypothetical protein SAMN05446037_104919 [Anaerovirgula multivorans]
MYNLLQKSYKRNKKIENAYEEMKRSQDNEMAKLNSSSNQSIQKQVATDIGYFGTFDKTWEILDKTSKYTSQVIYRDITKIPDNFSTTSVDGGKVFAKGVLKGTSSIVGTGMNIYTLYSDDSSFKRALAITDLIGDSVGLIFPPASIFTSSVNYFGSMIYDNVSDSTQEKMNDFTLKYLEGPMNRMIQKRQQAMAELLNHPDARIEGKRIVKGYKSHERVELYDKAKASLAEKGISIEGPMTMMKNILNKATEKQVKRIQKQLNDPDARIEGKRIVKGHKSHERVELYDKAQASLAEKGISIEGPMTMMKNMLNKATEKQVNRMQEQLSQPGARIVGNRIDTKNNVHERSSQRRRNQKKNASVLDLYNPTTTDRDKIYASRHGELVGKQPATSPNNYSVNNNNSFVVNITGMNKTTAEIANELVPKLKYSLANMSLAAL